MGRRILLVVLVLAVGMVGYYLYNSYDVRREGASGEVFSRDPLGGRVEGGIPKPEQDQPAANDAEATTRPAAAPAVPQLQPSEAPSAASQGTAPAADTITPNPPNGMTFSGSGKYQLYRQGNLTWRMNTETGQSCVLFATDEEWKKPKVYRNGCAGRR